MVLTQEELSLETIWKSLKSSVNPQTNELRARFDLLTSFCQGEMSVDEWFNAVQNQVNLAKYPPETAKILQRGHLFGFL